MALLFSATSSSVALVGGSSLSPRRFLTVKSASGKTYSQLAVETGLTNVYVAQLLRRQAQLKPDTVPKLNPLAALTDKLIAAMMSSPWRSYDPNLIQEPTIYRLNEAVMHFGESIKEIINEDFGDGIYDKFRKRVVSSG